MPALRLYGRKWQFGADDVTIPSLLCSLHRVAWLVLLGLFYHSLDKVSQACSNLVGAYLVISFCVYSVTFLVHVGMIFVSCQGTILDIARRSMMPTLFRVLTICVLMEIGLVVHGTYLSASSSTTCVWEQAFPYNMISIVVILSWIDITSVLCFTALAVTLSSADEDREARHEKSIRTRYCWGSAPSQEEEDREDDLEGEEEDHYEFHSDEERDSDTLRGQGSSTLHEQDTHMIDHDDDSDMGNTPATWNRRCRRMCACCQCLTCGLFGGIHGTGGPDAFQQVAVVLAGWFKNLDLIPSDIVAALFLMRAEQREQEAKAVEEILRERNAQGPTDLGGLRNRRRNLTHVGRWMWSSQGASERANSQIHAQEIRASRDARTVRVDSESTVEAGNQRTILELDPEARDLLMLASELSPYMLGIYGWMLFSYMHGIRGWVTLCTSPCRRCCRRQTELTEPLLDQGFDWNEDRSIQDGCCGWETTALMEGITQGSVRDIELVYASFTSLIGHKIPYSVCVDHAKQRVVVSIRGEMKISDTIVYATMLPESLEPYAQKWGFVEDVGARSHAHAGILRIAAWMREDLQDHDVLHRLFGKSSAEDAADSRLPDCREYALELTGHSLGAGVAIVLSLFLRPVFPQVRCLAFSPPGCVFDWKLANHCSSWVFCIFVGKDWAPRISWHSLLKLRGQILDTLRRDKRNKLSAIVAAMAGRPVDSLLYPVESVPDTEYNHQVQAKIDDLLNRRPLGLDSIRLYPPGKLLHLVKAETVRWNCCSKQFHYVPMWVDDRSALDEILLSSRMALDHFPMVVDKVLKQVINEFCRT